MRRADIPEGAPVYIGWSAGDPIPERQPPDGLDGRCQHYFLTKTKIIPGSYWRCGATVSTKFCWRHRDWEENRDRSTATQETGNQSPDRNSQDIGPSSDNREGDPPHSA